MHVPEPDTHVVSLELVPHSMHAWINLSGSMTQAIQRVTGKTPTVTIQLSTESAASGWEADQLGGNACFVRHIELLAGAMRCLTARSLALAGSPAAAALQNLGQRPLADLLFTGSWRQGDIVAIGCSSGDYGRAALWRDPDQHPLLVQEFFDSRFTEEFQP